MVYLPTFTFTTIKNHPNASKYTIHGSYTLPETNIFAPENGWLEYYFPIGMAYFQGLWLFVSGSVWDIKNTF